MDKILDSHFHIWNLQKIPMTWLKSIPRLHRDFSFDDWNEAYRGVSWVGGLYIESASEDFTQEMCFILEQKNPKILGICVADMQYIQQARSFREILHVKGAKRSLEKDFLENLVWLCEVDVPFEACMKNDELLYLETLLTQFPKLRIILNHMGNPVMENFVAYQEVIRRLSRHENLFIKLSSPDDFCLNTPQAFMFEIFRVLLQCFGEDRICFGSNFPVSFLKPMEWLEIINKSQIFREDSKIFYHNALEFYRLK